MTKPEDLYHLQLLETDLAGKRRRMQEVQEQLGDSEVVQKSQAALDKAEGEHQQKSSQQRDLELELRSLSEKIKTAEQRLYSGSVTNPKELADLQAEVGSLGRRKQSLEEALLETMIELEEVTNSVSNATTQLEDAQQKSVAEKSDLAEELEELKADLAELETTQSKLRSVIDEEDIVAFRSLWDRKAGVAVVRVQDGVCEGCGVEIAPSLEWKLREGEIHNCNNCDRLLVRL